MIPTFDTAVHEPTQTLLDQIGTVTTFDEAVAGPICSDESVESFKGSEHTSDYEEALQRDLRMILQEHSGNVIKK